jgi:hypothetical protein
VTVDKYTEVVYLPLAVSSQERTRDQIASLVGNDGPAEQNVLRKQ